MIHFLRLFLVIFAIPAILSGCSVYKDISSEEAEKMLSQENVIIIDVRSPEEYALGHLPKSININVNDKNFSEQLNNLDKDEKYLVYCRSGVRSVKAINIMKQAGFNKMYNLKTGIKGWKGPIE